MQNETRTYRVHLVMAISTTVEVEASSAEEARELAGDEAPAALNVSNRGIDEAGEWEPAAVYDENDVEVWTKDEDA